MMKKEEEVSVVLYSHIKIKKDITTLLLLLLKYSLFLYYYFVQLVINYAKDIRILASMTT